MTGPDIRDEARSEGRGARLLDGVRRAFREFLALPTLVIAAFLGLAAGSYLLDQGVLGGHDPLRDFLERRVFRSAESTSDLLGTVAGGLITVTSITISLLLVAIQQSASTMTAQVFDQFLRRRHNQFYFGFFVGLALYTLLTLATVTELFNPVYGGTITVLLTAAALYLLILLLYTKVNQMRPAEIVEAIHDHTLAARARQLSLVRRLRRTPRLPGDAGDPLRSQRHGFVTHIDFDEIGRAAAAAGGEVEAVLRVSLGTFVGFGDPLAEIRTAHGGGAPDVRRAVERAVRLERQRDIGCDPAYGIEQLEMIAWTSISTSKSNPAPGLLAIHALRDLLARWSEEQEGVEAERDRAALPIVYGGDPFGRLFDVLESLGVAASESLQHQSLAEVMRTLAMTYGRIPAAWRRRADGLVLDCCPASGSMC